MAFGVSWYLHVPVPNWIGSRNAEAVTVQSAEPVLPPPPPTRTAGSIFAEAEAAFAAGRWIEAADGYRHVVEIQSDFGPAYTRWTRALTNQHHVAEAAERGRQAVSMNPQSPDARAALAVALDWGGQLDRASQVGLEALKLDESSPAAVIALAEVYADQYRLREADELLARALEIAADNPESYRAQGVIRETRADYAGAVESYTHAVELAPNWSYLYVSLGHAYRALQLYDEAVGVRARPGAFADRRAGRGRQRHGLPRA